MRDLQWIKTEDYPPREHTFKSVLIYHGWDNLPHYGVARYVGAGDWESNDGTYPLVDVVAWLDESLEDVTKELKLVPPQVDIEMDTENLDLYNVACPECKRPTVQHEKNNQVISTCTYCDWSEPL